VLVAGLSPHVRGSHRDRCGSGRSPGSIPARAGEPACGARTSGHLEVYPRACGGAVDEATSSGATAGLSPRVRGSRGRSGRASPAVGSIPARAGEPPSRCRRGPHDRVYPRACGGAKFRKNRPIIAAGLSPRVRGAEASCCRSAETVGLSPRVRGSHAYALTTAP